MLDSNDVMDEDNECITITQFYLHFSYGRNLCIDSCYLEQTGKNSASAVPFMKVNNVPHDYVKH